MKLMELYQDKITGAISGLDRVRFRGTLRWLATQGGLGSFMSHSHILLKDFFGWVERLTAMVRHRCESRAGELGIEMRYLNSSRVDKEKLARQIAAYRRWVELGQFTACLLVPLGVYSIWFGISQRNALGDSFIKYELVSFVVTLAGIVSWFVGPGIGVNFREVRE